VHRCNEEGFVELVVADTATTGDHGASVRTHSARFVGLREAELREVAREGGAREVTFFGGHQGQPYDPERSADLIMVARRGG
jgi:hypothetical protein